MLKKFYCSKSSFNSSKKDCEEYEINNYFVSPRFIENQNLASFSSNVSNINTNNNNNNNTNNNNNNNIFKNPFNLVAIRSFSINDLKKNSTMSFSNNKLVDVTFQSDNNNFNNNNNNNFNNSINQTEKNDYNNENIINKYYQDLNKINSQNQEKNRKKTKEQENLKYFQEILKTNKVITNEDENSNIIGFSAYLYKNKGIINENKISININYEKENNKINILSLYDGHNGYQTSKYLKENLNKEILNDNNLISDTISTLFNSIQKMENNLYKIFLKNENKNNENFHSISSGSSLLIYLEINNEIFITNLGDSFSFISLNHSNSISILNQIHSISNTNELERVKLNGGEIVNINNNIKINPGALKITRSIGDIESKFPQFGGKINVISNRPDIISFKIKNEMDFIFLCNNEINNYLNPKEFCIIVYETMKNVLNKKKTFKIFLENVIINVMKYAIFKGAKNNLNCIFICFNNLKKLFYSCLNNEKIINDIIVTLNLSNKKFNFYEDLNEKKILSFNNSTNFNSDNQSYFNKFNNEKNSLSSNSKINNKVIHKIKVKKKKENFFVVAYNKNNIKIIICFKI